MGLIRPIIAAAQSGSIENIKILLNKGADITGGNVGMTAIAQAAFFGQSETVAFLKSKGAKHNIFSYTACGEFKQVNKFLNKNTKPESKVDEVGNSILHYASVRLEDELVKSILKKKVSPSLTNNCKESAVHLISNIRECDYSGPRKSFKTTTKSWSYCK